MNKKIKNESNSFDIISFDQKTKNQRSTLMNIVALLETLVKGLLEAEEKFYQTQRICIVWKQLLKYLQTA